mmetsp:Transcript_23044/g.72526  ORF Transcript_23044/g.72526 Transcript_23044/m.72526 type:complete len:311 (-) Transcript_23044:764-1696(-)
MELLQVPGEDVPHCWYGAVPVRETVHVTGATTAVAQVWGAAEPAGVGTDLAVAKQSPGVVVEELGSRGVPPTCTRDAPVAVPAAVPTTAGSHWLRARVLGLLAGRGHVVHDDVHDDLHSRRPARGHHGPELLRSARAGVQPEGHRLVLRPPLVAEHVLSHGRDLHRVKTIRPEVILALPGDVGKIPLPELHEDRAARLLTPGATGRLLVLAEFAEDGCILRGGGVGCGRVRHSRVFHQLEVFPEVRHRTVGVDGTSWLGRDIETGVAPQRDAAITVVHELEPLGARDAAAISAERAVHGGVDVHAQVAHK